MPDELKHEIDRLSLRQFGTREALLLMSCVAIVLAMRNISIRFQTEAWITYAPIVSTVVIAFGFRLFGIGKFRVVVACTIFAFVASVAHGVEMVARSPAFAFLRGHKVDLSSDPIINGIKVLVTTGEAIIVSTVIVMVLLVFENDGDDAG